MTASRVQTQSNWSRPYFVDDENHAYSNVRVLVEELRERGWLPANPLRSRRWTEH